MGEVAGGQLGPPSLPATLHGREQPPSSPAFPEKLELNSPCPELNLWEAGVKLMGLVQEIQQAIGHAGTQASVLDSRPPCFQLLRSARRLRAVP